MNDAPVKSNNGCFVTVCRTYHDDEHSAGGMHHSSLSVAWDDSDQHIDKSMDSFSMPTKRWCAVCSYATVE